MALLIRSSDAIRTRVMRLLRRRVLLVLSGPSAGLAFLFLRADRLDADSFSQCACPSAAGEN